MPLQRDMPSTMSDWFCNVPTRLADALGAAKFQFETLARLVQYYKARCGQQKVIMDRMRNEIEGVKELKRCAVGLRTYGKLIIDIYRREMEFLQLENRSLQSGMQSLQSIQSDEVNGNGKRRRVDTSRCAHS